MAGIYADIPGTRFALDQDGSVAKLRNISTGSAWADITVSVSAVMDTGNDDFIDLAGIGEDHTWEMSVAFPEPRTLNGLFCTYAAGAGGEQAPTFYYSLDTTDGTDGTWTVFTGPTRMVTAGTLRPFYRSSIGTFGPLISVKGVRWRQGHVNNFGSFHRIYCFHLYGSRPMTGVDRLAFWNPTTDQALTAAYLDFGDHPQGTVTTRQFRIKNISSTQSANTITVIANDLDNEFGGNLKVSTDNSTYLSSISIGNLASGLISPILYVRRTVPATESAIQRSARLLANAGSWV